MITLNAYAQQVLAGLAENQRLRSLRSYQRDGVHLWHKGKRYVNFSSNDYLGLGTHPRLMHALAEAATASPVGAGASVMVSGYNAQYAALEAQLATLKHTSSACVFPTGYMANIGTLSALCGRKDLILMDALCHASLLDGAQLCMARGTKMRRFRHNDIAHLEQLLQQYRSQYRYVWVVSESVFSMDGDTAPLQALATITHTYDGWLLVDDAHGLGVLQHSEYEQPAVDVWTGTLSKSVGLLGGYACASADVIAVLRNTARAGIYTTALPPALLVAICESLHLMQAEPQRRIRVLELAHSMCQSLSLPTTQSAIIPYIVGDVTSMLALAEHLYMAGYIVGAIRPPTVPEGSARLRISLSAAHDEADVAGLVRAIHEWRSR